MNRESETDELCDLYPNRQLFDTLLFYNVENEKAIAWLSEMSISGDLGEPQHGVPVMRFLAADARWVTVQTIYVNDGMSSPIN